MEKSLEVVDNIYNKVEPIIIFACFAIKMSFLVTREAYIKVADSEFVEVAMESIAITKDKVSDVAMTSVNVVSEIIPVITTTISSSVYDMSVKLMMTLALTGIYFAPLILKKMTSSTLHSILHAYPGNLYTRKINLLRDRKMNFENIIPNTDDLHLDWELIEIDCLLNEKADKFTQHTMDKFVDKMKIGGRDVSIIKNYF